MRKIAKNRGFTLIESLVSVLIFSIAVVTVMVALGRGISDTGYVKQKMTAEYLAVEAIEYFRNMRDTYVLYDTSGQTGWDNFKIKIGANNNTLCAQAGGNGCYLSDLTDYSNSSVITSLSVTACGATCPGLYYNPATLKYTISNPGGGAYSSGFVRKIRAQLIGSDEVKIFSTVSWRGGTSSVTFSESLHNWVE